MSDDRDLTRQETWHGLVSPSKRHEETIDSDTLRGTSRMKTHALPEVTSSLRVAVFCVCVLFLCIGVSYAWTVFVSNREWLFLVLSAVLIGTGGFLWMLREWARKLTLLILGVIVVLVPVSMASSGIFVEFWPYYEGRVSIRLVALGTTFLLVAPIFWFMYVISKYRDTFT